VGLGDDGVALHLAGSARSDGLAVVK
jgi:hypothetical protein